LKFSPIPAARGRPFGLLGLVLLDAFLDLDLTLLLQVLVAHELADLLFDGAGHLVPQCTHLSLRDRTESPGE
jgi:hypothetical protein